MHRTLWTVAFLALSNTGAHAAAPLNALFKCPSKGPQSACIEIALVRQSVDRADVFPYIELPSKGPQYLRLWGRLEGGPQTAFVLKVDWEPAWRPEDRDFPGIAYRGRSADNNPIILTDRGALEITTAGVDLPFSDYHLVDARRWKVITRLFSPQRGEYIFTSATRIGLWDDERKLCISAPLKEPGFLRVAPENCAARRASARS